jgi:Glycosyl hydrolase family 9
VIALRLMKGGSNDLVKISGVLAGILLAAMSGSAGAQTKVKILTNHIGYEASGAKHAVVQCEAGDTVSGFTIHEFPGGKVFSGAPKKALYGADYLVRARDPNGSFYRSVSAPGPGKKPEDRRISADTTGFKIKSKATDSGSGSKMEQLDDRAYEVSYRSGGGISIAALAVASTYKTAGDFNSSDYLKAAAEAFAFLEKNNPRLTNDGKENIVDDYCALLAATELYKATQEEMYKAAADKRASNLMSRLTTPHNRVGGQRASIPGVPIGLHLAPDPAHRILAHGAAEQRLQGAAHPARVGAGQVGAGNQRIGRQRAALVGPQHLAVPLPGFAAWSVQPRAWYFDLDATEGAHQRP